MRQALGSGALGRPRGIGCRGRGEGGSGWGTHVNPWLFHFNVWQNPLQLKKKKERKKEKKTESVYCRGQNKSISLFKLKVDGKEIKLIGEDYSFTGFEIKSKERNKIVKGVTFLERKEKIYEAWI